MNEIEFRAWDKITNRMASVDMIMFDTKQVKIAFYTNPKQHPETWYRKFGDVFLMQDTCLKDKNGKKIFIGDIVNTSSRIGVCEYVNGYVSINDNNKESDSDEISCDLWEVIGNIYENSELLETKWA